MTQNVESDAVECFNREELLNKLDFITNFLFRRISAKKFKTRQVDTVYLQYCRVLVQVINCYNTVLKDTELQELYERLEEVERRLIL